MTLGLLHRRGLVEELHPKPIFLKEKMLGLLHIEDVVEVLHPGHTFLIEETLGLLHTEDVVEGLLPTHSLEVDEGVRPEQHQTGEEHKSSEWRGDGG